MKKSIICVTLMLFCLVILTGCGNAEKEKNVEVDEEVLDDLAYEDEFYDMEETENEEEVKEEVKIDMPENVRIYSYQNYGPDLNYRGTYFDVYKIGNNALRTQVDTLGENKTIQNNKGYHYFKYKGDNTWDLYYRTDSKDWYLYTPDVTAEQFNTFMNINYLLKEDSELEGQEHETLHVDGIGDVDTVHIIKQDGSEDRLVDQWYSKDLKRNIKSNVRYTGFSAEILTYDTSITSFEIEVP